MRGHAKHIESDHVAHFARFFGKHDVSATETLNVEALCDSDKGNMFYQKMGPPKPLECSAMKYPRRRDPGLFGMHCPIDANDVDPSGIWP